MIVVADTSPLNYLLLIEEINLLPAIFGHVLLPPAVLHELQHPKASPIVRQWAASLPMWLEVRPVAPAVIPELMALDAGEREAIQLALELGISAEQSSPRINQVGADELPNFSCCARRFAKTKCVSVLDNSPS